MFLFFFFFKQCLAATTEALQSTFKEQTKKMDDVNVLKDSTNDLAEFSKNTFKKSTGKKVQQQLREAENTSNDASSNGTKPDGGKLMSATVSPKTSLEHFETPTSSTNTTPLKSNSNNTTTSSTSTINATPPTTVSLDRNANHLDNYGTLRGGGSGGKIPSETDKLLSGETSYSGGKAVSFEDSNLEARKLYRRKLIIITVILIIVLVVVALSILLPLILLR